VQAVGNKYTHQPWEGKLTILGAHRALDTDPKAFRLQRVGENTTLLKNFQRYAPVEMTKGRTALPGRAVTGTKSRGRILSGWPRSRFLDLGHPLTQSFLQRHSAKLFRPGPSYLQAVQLSSPAHLATPGRPPASAQPRQSRNRCRSGSRSPARRKSHEGPRRQTGTVTKQ